MTGPDRPLPAGYPEPLDSRPGQRRNRAAVAAALAVTRSRGYPAD